MPRVITAALAALALSGPALADEGLGAEGLAPSDHGTKPAVIVAASNCDPVLDVTCIEDELLPGLTTDVPAPKPVVVEDES